MTVGGSRSPLASRELRGEPPVSMVERMTLILDAFDGRAARLTLEEVAWRTRVAAVHRPPHSRSARQAGLGRSRIVGYCLGRRAIGLGGRRRRPDQIREAAAPLLHELHLQTGMVVHLSVLDGRESVYLDKVGGRFAATLPSRVGGRVLRSLDGRRQGDARVDRPGARRRTLRAGT